MLDSMADGAADGAWSKQASNGEVFWINLWQLAKPNDESVLAKQRRIT